jgi:hypothetical protein
MYEYTIYTYNSNNEKIVFDFVSPTTGRETVAEIHARAVTLLEEIRAQHGNENVRMSRRCHVGV